MNKFQQEQAQEFLRRAKAEFEQKEHERYQKYQQAQLRKKLKPKTRWNFSKIL